MSDTSEEKSLPASDKKLRDAREKGQIPHSREMVSAAVTVVSFGYLVFRAPQLATAFMDGLESLPASYDAPFFEAVRIVAGRLGFDLLSAVLPLAGLIVVAAVLANLVVNRGLVVSLDPIAPQADHLNPVAGFKRLLGLKNWIELLKSLAKLAVVGVLVFHLIAAALQGLVEIPSCGVACGLWTFGALLKRLLLVMAGLFLALGALDVGVQRWLFSRDQRMTLTEQKRERKDSEGDPEIKRQQREERRIDGAKTGLRNATFAIRGNGVVLALRYSEADTPVPALVARGVGEGAAALLAELGALRLPVVDDRETVASIAPKLRVGDLVTPDMYQAVVNCMNLAGVI